MKVVIVASNIGSIQDGVGGYAKYLMDAMRTVPGIESVYTENGNTDAKGKLAKIFSFEMSKAIIRTIMHVKNGETDTVLIEYPFKEYNPSIIFLIKALKKELHKTNGILVLSLHEYFRAKPGRQTVMRKLAQISDKIFVTEENIQKYFAMNHSDVFIRDIPSIVPVKWNENEEKNFLIRKFVYFGLIIANKAFDEMISAWKVFNKNMTYELEILTSSEINLEDAEKYNINVFRNLTDEEIAERMKIATYCILPIIPEVGLYNTTYKTATRAGCTIIGNFNVDFKENDFNIDVVNYSLDNFVKGMSDAANLSIEELYYNSIKAVEFGERYSFEYTAEQIINNITR